VVTDWDWLSDTDGCWPDHTFGPWYATVVEPGEESFDFRFCRVCGTRQRRVGGEMHKRFPLADGGSVPWAFLEAHRAEIKRKTGLQLEQLDEGLPVIDVVQYIGQRRPDTTQEAFAKLRSVIAMTFGPEVREARIE
jgi:hypothetical protein